MSYKRKRGVLSRADKGFILKHVAEGMTVEEMAKQLNITVNAVRNFIKGETGLEPDKVTPEDIEVNVELKESAEWRELKKQCTADELKYFERRYGDWMKQLKEDITASERTQIFMLIRIEILMNRDLTKAKAFQDEIEVYSREASIIMATVGPLNTMDKANREMWKDLTEKVNNLQARSSEATENASKYRKDHSELMKQLKSTREQRVTKVENLKASFIDIVKELMDEGKRKEVGEQIELMRMAAEKEMERLSEHHTYIDGSIDRAILNCDTVILDENEKVGDE